MAEPKPTKVTRRNIAMQFAPFFERMAVLRRFSSTLDVLMVQRRGTSQDLAVEQRHRCQKRTLDNDEIESLIDYDFTTPQMQTITRMCQIVLLCSTFESFCRNAIPNSEYWKLDANLVKGADTKKKRFLFTILEKATAKGMKSSAWQRYRNHLNTLVNLRNHLVHEGLDGSEGLQRKLRKSVGSIDEIEGASLEDKVGRVAPIAQFIDVPQPFLDKMFDVLEQLAADLIVPNDHELPAPPSVAEVVELFTKTMH